jgi:hypothetical protein
MQLLFSSCTWQEFKIKTVTIHNSYPSRSSVAHIIKQVMTLAPARQLKQIKINQSKLLNYGSEMYNEKKNLEVSPVEFINLYARGKAPKDFCLVKMPFPRLHRFDMQKGREELCGYYNWAVLDFWAAKTLPHIFSTFFSDARMSDKIMAATNLLPE